MSEASVSPNCALCGGCPEYLDPCRICSGQHWTCGVCWQALAEIGFVEKADPPQTVRFARCLSGADAEAILAMHGLVRLTRSGAGR